MARFDRINNQAPAEQELQADKINVGRTAFDFSCIHNGNAMIGALTPVDCFDVVPNEDIDISMSALLEFRNPSTRQLFNGMRVYFHAYYNRLTDLWEGAKNWIDNGRRGNVSLVRPLALYKANGDITAGSSDRHVYINACTPMSLLNYLGLPAETYHVYKKSKEIVSPLYQFKPTCKDEFRWSYGDNSIVPEQITTNANLSNNNTSNCDYFPADCCMAYQRNWRDFYSNKNLLQGNQFWFPDNEEHFILSYGCTIANKIEYGDENSLNGNYSTHFDADKWAAYLFNMLGMEFNSTSNPYSSLEEFKVTREINNPRGNNSNPFPNLFGLKFRQFRGDRFTASSPFPDLIRGDVPILNSSMDAITAHFDNAHTNVTTGNNLRDVNGNETKLNMYGATVDSTARFLFSDSASDSTAYGDIIGISGDVNIPLSSLNITMSDIYTLETLTTFRRRLGLTNGDYNEMIKSQYGVSPNVHDRKATYIGGFYQDFAFSSVTQSSESTIDSPLGQKAGQGVSSGTGTIGHFHTPDFGWIQIYMSIVPDVYYTQGKPRMFSKKSNLEMYFPLFNNLPAQAIRNDELYNTDSVSDNEAPFSYEDRYAEYKSRTNRVSGLMGLPHSIATYDASRVIARRFDSSPAFNSTFVTMIPENVDMNVFAVVDEPPFDFSIGIACRRVSPMPYTAIEGSLSSPTLNSMGA